MFIVLVIVLIHYYLMKMHVEIKENVVILTIQHQLNVVVKEKIAVMIGILMRMNVLIVSTHGMIRFGKLMSRMEYYLGQMDS
mgnify:CR=1 FL=1